MCTTQSKLNLTQLTNGEIKEERGTDTIVHCSFGRLLTVNTNTLFARLFIIKCKMHYLK